MNSQQPMTFAAARARYERAREALGQTYDKQLARAEAAGRDLAAVSDGYNAALKSISAMYNGDLDAAAATASAAELAAAEASA